MRLVSLLIVVGVIGLSNGAEGQSVHASCRTEIRELGALLADRDKKCADRMDDREVYWDNFLDRELAVHSNEMNRQVGALTAQLSQLQMIIAHSMIC